MVYDKLVKYNIMQGERMDNNTDTIYIMLSFTGTILSRIVKVVTSREYSHVSVALDLEFNSLYSFGRLNPRNPFSGGFVKEEIDSGTYKLFKNTVCQIYSLKVTSEQYQALKQFIDDFYADKDRYKFNIIGLFGPMINVPMNREYKYFCSQFVGKALLTSGIYSFNKDIGLIKPIEFSTIPGLQLVYEGRLQDYPEFLASMK